LTLTDLHQALRSAFRPPSAAGQATTGPAPSAPLRFERTTLLRLLAARRLARPGFMSLRAVRDGKGLRDFVWDFVDDDAARLLGLGASDLRGLRLRDVLVEPQSCAAVFGQYRGVVEHGTAAATRHAHVVNGLHDTYRHGAVRLNDGVAVSLTNVSAVKRARALQAEFRQRLAMTGLHRAGADSLSD